MGWIKLHRELLDSQIFASEKGLKIWIWILLKANHKQRFVPIRIGKGESIVKIERGQFLFGRFSAEEELNINGSTIYKWIKKMELLEMIELDSNSHYTVLTVCKYNEYNDIEKAKVATIEQPLNNQVTTVEHKQESKESKELERAKALQKRKDSFVSEIQTHKSSYDKDMLNMFYNYWTELNKSKTKMRFELEKTFEVSKRLVTWAKRQK